MILAIDFLSNLFCSVLFFVINASPRIVLINVSQVESIACRFLFHASICWLTEINHCWHAFFFISLFLKPIRSTFFCSIFVAKVGVKIRYFILGVGCFVSSIIGVCRPTRMRKKRSCSNNFVFILFFDGRRMSIIVIVAQISLNRTFSGECNHSMHTHCIEFNVENCWSISTHSIGNNAIWLNEEIA